MEEFLIRFVREEDAPALLGIYSYYANDTPLTFECKAPTLSAFAQRIREISSVYPYLVAQSRGSVVGFAYAHRHRERAAYDWNAELSVYLSRAYQGLGIGRALYGAILEILPHQHVQNAYGVVVAPNPASEALHEAMGFTTMGYYRKTGYKLGAWRDLRSFEKRLFEGDPLPVLPIGALAPEVVCEILSRHGRTIGRRAGRGA